MIGYRMLIVRERSRICHPYVPALRSHWYGYTGFVPLSPSRRSSVRRPDAHCAPPA
ncbi:hypothetical protein FRAAL0892 [Frankia alni ACN14a]|uniref:Uncharacterized protein n=1 Tax=Frankia alni (strain DSM 45986 / CECT 9034 / ACN14a) TaxID=326424 RepID=Q0RSA6_FRAAA|nr:hypothetical protein FRAAL0892 [Frankia alni ACN14a]